MNREHRAVPPTGRGVLAEWIVFLAASLSGVYSLGQGLIGLVAPDQGSGDLGWLLVTAIALLVLCAQMARVQDNWPRWRTDVRPAPARRTDRRR